MKKAIEKSGLSQTYNNAIASHSRKETSLLNI